MTLGIVAISERQRLVRIQADIQVVPRLLLTIGAADRPLVILNGPQQSDLNLPGIHLLILRVSAASSHAPGRSGMPRRGTWAQI